MSSGVGGGGDGRSTSELFPAGTRGARVVAALGGGGDGRSTGGSRAKASHRFFSRWGHAQWKAGRPHIDFFSRNMKLTGRFGTVAYMVILHA
jgi:hypothetical protein